MTKNLQERNGLVFIDVFRVVLFFRVVLRSTWCNQWCHVCITWLLRLC